MKKIIALFLLATVLSCSSEDQAKQDVANTALTSGPVLDGQILSFKSQESFIEEYSSLAGLNREELQKWILSKGLASLMNASDESADIEEDIVSESRVVYSDALKAILNSDSKVKIGDKVLWLNQRNFYLLSEMQLNKTSDELIVIKDNLEVFGQLLSLSKSSRSLTDRSVIPNENRIKTFASPEFNVSGSRIRHVVDLFNETIVLNDIIQSSKMYVRSILQYRSCSTFRCTWKQAYNVRTIYSNFYCAACGPAGASTWSLTSNIYASGVSGTQTYLIANWAFIAPLNPFVNFAISGPITCNIDGVSPVAGISIDLSWY